MVKRDIIIGATKHLNECMQFEDFIDSAVYSLFVEAILFSHTKPYALKLFRNYCNNELGRSYLINDSIYGELKSFLNNFKL